MLTRRLWIASVAGALLSACGRGSCERSEQKGPSLDPAAAKELDMQEVDFDPGGAQAQKAVVLSPRWGSPGERYPLLIALHGRGESGHGLGVGAWGWVHDYWLDRAFLRLRRPPLDQASLLGITNDSQLQRLNGLLAAQPFRGLVVACPYTPDILGGASLDAAEPFADFVEHKLLPKLRADFPVIGTAAATGIDGVSLGGRVALLTAFSRPALFGALGTLQAAVRKGEVEAFAERALKALGPLAVRPPLRLLTSEDDPFRPTLEALASALAARGIQAEYNVVPGPHDYAFNRGPGSYEMLLWHERKLRGEKDK